eukprot:scaffold172613_cov23-Tisochrysis_lutea.AAC.2
MSRSTPLDRSRDETPSSRRTSSRSRFASAVGRLGVIPTASSASEAQPPVGRAPSAAASSRIVAGRRALASICCISATSAAAVATLDTCAAAVATEATPAVKPEVASAERKAMLDGCLARPSEVATSAMSSSSSGSARKETEGSRLRVAGSASRPRGHGLPSARAVD